MKYASNNKLLNPTCTAVQRSRVSSALCLKRREVRLMEVTAWNNGRQHASGAGYGLKLRASDRDRHFNRAWSTILLVLPDRPEPIEVNVAKPSFWSATCRELISRDIGKWLIEDGYAPWERGKPTRFRLETVSERRFAIRTA